MGQNIRGSAWVNFTKEISLFQLNQYQAGVAGGSAAGGQAVLDTFMPTNIHESPEQRRAEARQLRELMREVAAERNLRNFRQQ